MDIATVNVEPVIVVEHLKRVYGSGVSAHEAIKDSSFYVAKGEVFGLLGTNGAGKTSTLEILEGIAKPSGGSVAVFGIDPYADRSIVRAEMGIMLQSGGLPLGLTVVETLQMWQGTCSHPRSIDEVLRDVELEHRREVRVGALSGGEQRRLDLGCALLGNPSLLFLDEPTTGLDPESRRNVWKLLARLKNQGVTMVLTTHYLEEAEILCDRLAIMHRGEIAVIGTLAEIVSTVSAEISFSNKSKPPHMPGTTVQQVDGNITIFTDRIQEDTYRVLEWARVNGVELENFSARPATLETVFLNVAGKTPALVNS